MQIVSNHAKHNEETTKKILEDLARVVKPTFGPTGSTSLLISDHGDRKYTASSTKDGFTVLSKVQYAHPIAIAMKRLILDTIVSLLKTASDGTTTTTLLINELYTPLLKIKNECGLAPQVFTNITKRVVKDMIQTIDDLPKVDVDLNIVRDLIATSTNNDEELTGVLNEVILDLTNNGERVEALADIAISYRANPLSPTTSYKIESGYNIPRATAFEAHHSSRTEKCNLILINSSLATPDEFRGFIQTLKMLAQHSVRSLVITYNINNRELLAEMVNTLAGQFRSRGQEFNVSVLEYQENGTVINHAEHEDFEAILAQGVKYDVSLNKTLEDLFGDVDVPEGFDKDMPVIAYLAHNITNGNVAQGTVTFNKTSTIISDIQPVAGREVIDIYLEKLNKELEEEKDKDIRISIQQRIAKIDGKFAQISIGGDNEWDINRKQDSIDDVLGSIRSVVTTGPVAGLSTLINKIAVKFSELHSEELKNTLYSSITKAIQDAYRNITRILIESTSLPEDMVEIMLDILWEPVTPENILTGIDIRKILTLQSELKEVYATDVMTNGILNTREAEKRILEASVNAVLSLISVNQIVFPDEYDCNTYKNSEK